MHKTIQLNLLDGSTVIGKITYTRLKNNLIKLLQLDVINKERQVINNTLIKTYYSQIINKINHQETV